jgi:hypothetical protein
MNTADLYDLIKRSPTVPIILIFIFCPADSDELASLRRSGGLASLRSADSSNSHRPFPVLDSPGEGLVQGLLQEVHGLDDPHLFDGGCQFVQGHRVHLLSGLTGIGLNLGQGHHVEFVLFVRRHGQFLLSKIREKPGLAHRRMKITPGIDGSPSRGRDTEGSPV